MHKTSSIALDEAQLLNIGKHQRREKDGFATSKGLFNDFEKVPPEGLSLRAPTDVEYRFAHGTKKKVARKIPMNISQEHKKTIFFQAGVSGTQVQDDVDNGQETEPIVRWTQSDSRVLLRVYIREGFQLSYVEDFFCSVEDNGNILELFAHTKLHESGRGKNYRFSIALYSAVDKEKYYCYKLNRCLSIELKKKSSSDVLWPRLTESTTHLDWIREWDHYDDTLEETNISNGLNVLDGLVFDEVQLAFKEIDRLTGAQHQTSGHNIEFKRQRNSHEPSDRACEHLRQPQSQSANGIKIPYKNNRNRNIFDPFRKNLNRFKEQLEPKESIIEGESSDSMKYDYRREQNIMDSSKNTAKHALNCRKTYLFLYNLLMFVMFLMVHLILTIKGLTGSMDDESVQAAAYLVKLLTYTQLLESIHPMLGLVPGGPFMPFLQVIGRLLVNHFLTDSNIRLNSAPYAHYLFIVWSSIEIFRYSFYALRVFNVEIYPITWCRYTLFMPLYPIGGFCEAQIVSATISQYESTGEYSISLPNVANFSFILPSFLRFYTFALLGPSILYLMRYMWSQRCRQLKEKIA